MTMLAVIGTIDVKQGLQNRVLLLLAHGARCLEDEPGTLHFNVIRPRDGDARLLIFDVFRDDTAFEAHRNAPSITRSRQETQGMVVSVDVTKGDLVDIGG